jgi:predicted DNA-binding transcriptional regulator AlpA
MTKTAAAAAAPEMLPVGTVEIAEYLGVTRKHVDAWRSRGGRRGVPFPVPRWTVGGRPAWLWTDVQAWYAATEPA